MANPGFGDVREFDLGRVATHIFLHTFHSLIFYTYFFADLRFTPGLNFQGARGASEKDMKHVNIKKYGGSMEKYVRKYVEISPFIETLVIREI